MAEEKPNYLTESQAKAMFTVLAGRDDIPYNMVEYGCVDRSELMIANMLAAGIPAEAIGRVSTLVPDLSKEAIDGAGKKLDAGQAPDVTYVPDRFHEAAFKLDLMSHTSLTPETETVGFGKTTFTRSAATPHIIESHMEGMAFDYKFHPGEKAYWSVGHIAPTVQVIDDETREIKTMVMDPSMGKGPMEIEDWRSKQGIKDSLIVQGGLGSAPSINEHFFTKEQAGRWADLADETPQERTRKFLNIEEDSALHPSKWTGYSIGGGPNGPDGKPLPDWNELIDMVQNPDTEAQGKKLIRDRIASANRNLQPIRDYKNAIAAGMFSNNPELRLAPTRTQEVSLATDEVQDTVTPTPLTPTWVERSGAARGTRNAVR